jgi:hypothetical protein
MYINAGYLVSFPQGGWTGYLLTSAEYPRLGKSKAPTAYTCPCEHYFNGYRHGVVSSPTIFKKNKEVELGTQVSSPIDSFSNIDSHALKVGSCKKG